MSWSIPGEHCWCCVSRCWGMTGEFKSEVCIFKIDSNNIFNYCRKFVKLTTSLTSSFFFLVFLARPATVRPWAKVLAANFPAFLLTRRHRGRRQPPWVNPWVPPFIYVPTHPWAFFQSGTKRMGCWPRVRPGWLAPSSLFACLYGPRRSQTRGP